MLNAVVLALLIGVAGRVLNTILSIVIWIFCHVQRINDRHAVAHISSLLSKHGFCSARSYPSGVPSDGMHVLRRGKSIVVARLQSAESSRGSTTKWYTLYIIGFIGCVEEKNAGTITVRYMDCPAAWRTITSSIQVRPPTARKWQRHAADILSKEFTKRGTASMIISGAPGIGKSTMGIVLAASLKRRGLTPAVVQGLDLLAKGLSIDDATDPLPTKNEPLIIMLDEFDTAIEHALSSKKGDAEAITMAESKGRLVALLDRLSSTIGVIVIATTNVPISEMREDPKKAPFLRKGRFNTCIENR